MGRISKALDKLRRKCTSEGAHPNGNSTADILDCIAEHYEGGGSSLPEVTGDDNGKVLKVVEGEWDKGDITALPEVTGDDNGKVLKVVEGEWAKGEAGGGGAGAFIVTAAGTLNIETGALSNITIDKTIGEIATAAETGVVVCRVAGTIAGVGTIYGFASLAEYLSDEETGYVFLFYRRLWEITETESSRKIQISITATVDADPIISGNMDVVLG